MANAFLNAQEYANVMLLLLKNQLVYGRLVDGQFKDQVTDENGLTISVKRPPRFVATSGASLKAQDLVTGSVPLAVDQYKNVHISVGDLEYVQSYNALMQNETMKSAASTLAHDVDKFIAGLSLGFFSWVAGGSVVSGAAVGGADSGSNATLISTGIQKPQGAMAAHSRLMAQGVPDSDLSGVLTFSSGELIRGSLLSDFTPDINRTALEKTRIPLISSIDWYATQQNPTFTAGTRLQGDGSSTGTQVNGASQNVDYRNVKGSGTSAGMTQTLILKTGNGITTTIKIGDVFTIQNVYAWDWRNQQALPYLQQFTVVGDSSGAVPTTGIAATYNGASPAVATVTITPPIIVQGTNDSAGNSYANSAFGTVDSVPADSAYIQFAGAASAKSVINPVFHKRAIALVSARLQMPFTGVASFATDPDTGIAIRYWRGSDITTGAHVHRWDMIYGGRLMDGYLGCRVTGPNTAS